jgi:hypothetical protein
MDIFNKKSIDAYTINSCENTLMKDVVTDFDMQEQIDLTSLRMSEFLSHFGITTSPDLSKFDLIEDKNGKVSPVPFEEIIARILPYLKIKEKIIISDEISFSRKMLNNAIEVKKVSEKSFFNAIRQEPFAIAIDGDYNLYLQSELFPNHFAALFCLYHSLIYISGKKKSTKLSETQKELTT